MLHMHMYVCSCVHICVFHVCTFVCSTCTQTCIHVCTLLCFKHVFAFPENTCLLADEHSCVSVFSTCTQMCVFTCAVLSTRVCVPRVHMCVPTCARLCLPRVEHSCQSPRPVSSPLNFGGRKRSGVFGEIWPSATKTHRGRKRKKAV